MDQIWNYEHEELEQLEWRLYSEVYHSKKENENNSIGLIPNKEPTNDDTIIDKVSLNRSPRARYFSSKNSSSVSSSTSLPLFIPFDGTQQPALNYPLIQNRVTVNTNRDSDHNITVNQYTVPVILHSDEIVPSLPSNNYLASWPVKNAQPSLHRPRRKEKRLRKKLKRTMKRNVQKNSVLIYISDDSNDDCVLIDTKMKESDSDEDAVVFIPPPPPIIINVEEDEEVNVDQLSESNPEGDNENISRSPRVEHSQEDLNKLTVNNSNENNELLNTPESSNDFLDNTTVANNSTDFNFSLHGSDFNFSLHGSDFNVSNPADFARPNNPSQQADFCETGSSTASTNDQSGEFNNSVKTIVFNEVEFPKEDIFAEKNLDTFGTLITTKRNSMPKNSDMVELAEVCKQSLCEQGAQTVQFDDGSSTSSESDDEASKSLDRTVNKSLPNLSPMPSDINKQNINEVETQKADVSRSDEEGSKSLNKIICKRLQNLSPMSPNVICTILKEFTTQETENSNSSNTESDYEPHIRKASKKDETVSLNSTSEKNLEIQADNSELTNSKKSKNKRKSDVKDKVGDSSFSADEFGGRNHKKKKKKSREVEMLTQEAEMENVGNKTLDVSEITSPTKKKMYLKKTDLDNSNNLQKRKKKLSQGSESCEIHDNSFTKENLENTGITEKKSKILSKDSHDVVTIERFSKKRKKSIDNGNISSNKKIPDHSDKIISSEKTVESGVKAFTERVHDNMSENDKSFKASDDDLIIIEEPSCVFEIDDSSSSGSFVNLETIGKDIKLANCLENFIRNPPADVIDSSKVIFDVEEIQSTQSDDPEKWRVLDSDVAVFIRPDRGGRRCNRCRRFGHIGINCTEKSEPPRCTLCGESNHQELRCPNKVCRQCGYKGDCSNYCEQCYENRKSECSICHMRGHFAETCPDLWRRYHLTVEPGPLVKPEKSVLKPRYQQWCSGCARRGHLEHECNYINRLYPPVTPLIMDYDDVLNETSASTSTVQTNVSKSQHLPSLLDINIPECVSAMLTKNNSNNIDLIEESQHSNLDHQEETVTNREIHLLHNENNAPQSLETRIVTADPSGLNLKVVVPNVDSLAASPITSDLKQNVLEEMKLNFYSINSTNLQANANPGKTFDCDAYAKKVIMSMSHSLIKKFLGKELHELETNVSRCNPRLLKNLFYKYQSQSRGGTKPLSSKSLEKISHLHRRLNMLVFGIHKFRDGRLHLSYLKKFLNKSAGSDLNDAKRKSLWNSYSYIFGDNKHVNVHYIRFLKIIIEKYDKSSELHKHLL